MGVRIKIITEAQSTSSFFNFCQITLCADSLDSVPNDKNVVDVPIRHSKVLSQNAMLCIWV